MDSYLEQARQTRRFTLARLCYPPGLADLQDAPYLTYIRSDCEPEWIDLWYLATQIGADAELLRCDPSLDCQSIDLTAIFLDRLRDEQEGGYLARGRPDGSLFLRPDKFSDDHGHLGLMMLEAWRALADEAYLTRAVRAADFLLDGGVWDRTFGGGFWWNSRHGDSLEGKPAQANGLAAQLFLELYGITAESRYLDWAERTLTWLDECLYDARAGLYRWSIHFNDLGRRRGEAIANRFFNYDQGIIMEAWLARYRNVKAEPSFLQRAQSLATRLEAGFWHRPHGGFNLEQGVEQVLAIYSAWLTPSLLALHGIDHDERWLDLARRNVDALNSYLRAPDGGYYKGAFLDAGHWSIDRTRDTVANAGLQWAQASLARG